MTYILGIHIGHDSSAALLQDGIIVADVSEERFVRVKHYAGLPFESIRFCLRYAGIQESDVDVIAFSKSSAPHGAHLLFPDVDFRRRDVRGILREAVLPMVNRGAPRSGLPVYLAPFQTSKTVEVDFVEHHKAHAASAYYTCGRPVAEKVTVATLDGVGDGVSCAIWRRTERLSESPIQSQHDWFPGLVLQQRHRSFGLVAWRRRRHDNGLGAVWRSIQSKGRL